MRFSILTPSFQQGRFIEQNIRSVLQQDVAGTEHIICDAGSTDETVRILRQYDDRLHKWVSEKDGGQADALNKALGWATGDVVGWLNADDYYQPNILRRVAEAFDSNPEAVLVYGDYNVVLEDGTIIRRNRPSRFDYDICLYASCIFTNAAAFFRRDRLVECGGFDASYQFAMDWEMYLRFMRGNRSWVRIPQTLANFRLHRASKTSRQGDIAQAEMLRMRERERPGLSPEEWHRRTAHASRKMRWHLLADGRIFEKVWFQIFRRRHYAEYFGDQGVTIPIPVVGPLLHRFLDVVDPVQRRNP